MEAFAWHLRHGSLGADVGRFAPHLQEILAAGPPPPPPLTPGQQRKNWLVGAAVTALVVVPIAAAVAPPAGTDRFVFVAGGMLLGFSALRSAYSAWNFFRDRSWGQGVFLALLALLLAFWCIG